MKLLLTLFLQIVLVNLITAQNFYFSKLLIESGIKSYRSIDIPNDRSTYYFSRVGLLDSIRWPTGTSNGTYIYDIHYKDTLMVKADKYIERRKNDSVWIREYNGEMTFTYDRKKRLIETVDPYGKSEVIEKRYYYSRKLDSATIYKYHIDSYKKFQDSIRFEKYIYEYQDGRLSHQTYHISDFNQAVPYINNNDSVVYYHPLKETTYSNFYYVQDKLELKVDIIHKIKSHACTQSTYFTYKGEQLYTTKRFVYRYDRFMLVESDYNYLENGLLDYKKDQSYFFYPHTGKVADGEHVFKAHYEFY